MGVTLTHTVSHRSGETVFLRQQPDSSAQFHTADNRADGALTTKETPNQVEQSTVWFFICLLTDFPFCHLSGTFSQEKHNMRILLLLAGKIYVTFSGALLLSYLAFLFYQVCPVSFQFQLFTPDVNIPTSTGIKQLKYVIHSHPASNWFYASLLKRVGSNLNQSQWLVQLGWHTLYSWWHNNLYNLQVVSEVFPTLGNMMSTL